MTRSLPVIAAFFSPMQPADSPPVFAGSGSSGGGRSDEEQGRHLDESAEEFKRAYLIASTAYSSRLRSFLFLIQGASFYIDYTLANACDSF